MREFLKCLKLQLFKIRQRELRGKRWNSNEKCSRTFNRRTSCDRPVIRRHFLKLNHGEPFVWKQIESWGWLMKPFRLKIDWNCELYLSFISALISEALRLTMVNSIHWIGWTITQAASRQARLDDTIKSQSSIWNHFSSFSIDCEKRFITGYYPVDRSSIIEQWKR